MKWQVVATHNSGGEEVAGKWEIADEKGNLITNDEGYMEEVIAQRLVDAHNSLVS